MAHDVFRPRRPLPQCIYDAFQKEATKRDGRKVEEWQRKEIEAVFNAASAFAEKHGIPAPSMTDVEETERLASGHTDYGAKWAYGLEQRMEAA